MRQVWGKGCGLRMGFQTMGRRRPLSRFMFGVAFLIWMASTVLLSQNPSALLWTVAPYLSLVCMQLTTAFVDEMSCNHCYWFCYEFAQNQFAQYQQSSNEPLRYHTTVPLVPTHSSHVQCCKLNTSCTTRWHSSTYRLRLRRNKHLWFKSYNKIAWFPMFIIRVKGHAL